jgi:hypothetical protein
MWWYADGPSLSRRRVKKRVVVLVTLFVVLAIWVVGLGCWPFVTWSTLNCWHYDVDVNSGRIRYQRYLVGFCTSESVEESSLSRLLGAEVTDQPADWHRVLTFSPRVGVSPHYQYHGAIGQIHRLESMWELRRFPPATKRQVARDVLLLWRRGESYVAVDDYITELESVSRPWDESLDPIDVGDLPSPESIESFAARRT